MRRNTMKNDQEPKIWITVAKLVIGAIVLIGGTGLALWYAESLQETRAITNTDKAPTMDWGIAGDSPLRR